MTSKFVYFSFVAACALSLTAAAQTGSAGVPNAPSAMESMPSSSGTKIATINIQGAIEASNEGQRDLAALYKKLEPRQTELKSESDELDSLKKQLNTQGDKLNDDAKANLIRQIDQKQKSFDRGMQDFRDDAGSQQQEIMQRIMQKLAPILMKYVQQNGYGLLFDTSKQWPDSPVIPVSQTFDITKPVVDAYNAQSGVPAPASGAPAATHPTHSGATAGKPSK